MTRIVRFFSLLALLLCALLLAGCDAGPTPSPEAPAWSLAIHAGAGRIPRDIPPERERAYREGLERALGEGARLLEEGRPALEVVETVVRMLEDDPLFNAGRGAVLNWHGEPELDAAIMDGRDQRCGAVAGVRTVRHPVSLARAVMENTRHVLLAGTGAEAFADEAGVERVEPEWLITPRRHEQWRELREKDAEAPVKGTVGAVARDRDGHLAAATSTGGLAGKLWGRVGDVPIVGAGTYASDDTCAVSCTGTGEEFIRHSIAASVAMRMRLLGEDVNEAATHAIGTTLEKDVGGLIAVGEDGSIIMRFNTSGMFRAAADAGGHREVAIW